MQIRKVETFLFPTRVLARSGSADPAFNYAISAKWHSDKCQRVYPVFL